MRILSIVFVVFFIVLLILLYMTKTEKHRLGVLLIASYLFYAYADYRFLILLFLQTVMVYFIARIIDHKKVAGYSAKAVLAVGVTLNIGILAIFKYANFFISNVLNYWGGAKWDVVLPLGMSFYTFQAISYIVYVYQEKQPLERSFKKVALYVGFFPQITSGPIVKARDFFRQLENEHSVKKQNLVEGGQIFLLGLIKKIVIADRLGRAVDAVYATPKIYSGVSILLVTIAYSIQIYCDFSGYSDMAIGIAKSLGFDLGKNFNFPYIARNPSEFWQRWHISLSSWFKEYVYIPLGGSRRGVARTCGNLFFVMLLSGVWHGAGWNYIFWGIYHGIGSVLHKLFSGFIKKNNWSAKTKRGKCISNAFSILLTFLFVNFGWVIFRSDCLNTAKIILYRTFTLADGVSYIYLYTIIFIVLLSAVAVYIYVKRNGEATYIFMNYEKTSSWFILGVIIFGTLMFFYPGESAFIYGKF